MKSCALSGHRVLRADFSVQKLRDALLSLLEQGVTDFYCGMALGFDLAACEELMRLRAQYPLRIVACIPCAGQEERYPPARRRQYARLCAACDECVVLFSSYEQGCMFARNRYMVDRADVLLAYLNAPRGGTFYTVRYAQKKGVPVLFV